MMVKKHLINEYVNSLFLIINFYIKLKKLWQHKQFLQKLIHL
jgi:hypothetical protein